MLAYLKLEIVRTLRNRRYVVLIVGFPVAFYLLFTHILSGNASAQDRADFYREFMIAMSAYGALGSAMMATGPRIALERTIGWNRQLRLTPLSPRGALVAKILSAMVSAVVAPVAVNRMVRSRTREVSEAAVPSATTRPRAITTTRSAYSSASAR